MEPESAFIRPGLSLACPHTLSSIPLQVSKTLNDHISKFCQVTLESLAYAGTGDVLKVQQLLAMCGEHVETDDTTAWKVRRLSCASSFSSVLSLPGPGCMDMDCIATCPHFHVCRACTKAPP